MPPNILIFMADHQRADTLYPWQRAVAPNLDQFASQGVTFSNTYCPAPHCCPSRATFFTGLYPSGHGVWNNICNDQALSRGLKPGVRLWSEDLAQAGYALHFSGKWHVSVEESPAQRGWQVHALSGAKGDHHGRTWQEYQDLPPSPVLRAEGSVLRPGYGAYQMYQEAKAPPQHDETAVQAGLDVLASLAGSPDPWCLFVSILSPHDPYVVEGKYLDLYPLERIPLPDSYPDRMADKPAIYRRMREMLFDQLSELEVRQGIRHYLAMCTYIDELFGRFLRQLVLNQQEEDTLVLFTSDHGDYCGEHGLFAKGIPCFRGAYHVPGVMRWPAGIRQPGRLVDALVSLADFGPTFLNAAGVRVERHFTGASLLPFLQASHPAAWREAIHTQCNGVELYYTQRSVMTQEWKYVFNGFDQDELYHRAVDPHEMRNLALEPGYQNIKRQMCQLMWRFAHQEGDTAINPYITVGLAPYGPGVIFEDSRQDFAPE
jgi:arylsulfatase A-like enzyme